MTWKIRVVADAEAEFEATARWFDEHAGLRTEFVEAIDEAIYAIAEGPLRYPQWQPGSSYRKFVVRRFPYVVLYRMRTTVPCADAPSDLPALEPDVHAPPEPRATAAHPRAFRGTRYRPPRPEQPDAVDVRPYLLTRRHTDLVLEQLGQPRGIDPYVAWNHRVDATANFDPMSVMHLLPLFKDCTWSDGGAFASLARSLQLHRDPLLRSALANVYLAARDSARALGWWHQVLAHDPEQRIEAANLVSMSGVAKLEPVEPSVGALLGSLPAFQQWSFYRGLVGGASPAYLESGHQLGALSPTKFDDPPPGHLDVTSLIETTVERLDRAMDEDSGAEFWRTHL